MTTLLIVATQIAAGFAAATGNEKKIVPNTVVDIAEGLIAECARREKGKEPPADFADFAAWYQAEVGISPDRARRSGVYDLDILERAFYARPAPPVKVLDDDDGWVTHTPGDPMPCAPELLVEIRTTNHPSFQGAPVEASGWYWGDGGDNDEIDPDDFITGWRVA